MRAVVGSVNRDTVVWRVYDASRVNDGANALMQQRARRRSVVAVADYSPAAAAADAAAMAVSAAGGRRCSVAVESLLTS